MSYLRTSLFAVITWAVHLALYLAYTGNAGVREWIAGAVTAAIATLAVLVFARAGKVSFRFRLRDIVQIWRVPWYAVSGTAEVMQGLFKQLFTAGGAPSFIAAVPFDVGDLNDRADAGRRALAVTYTTATPNSVVFGIVKEQRLLLYHQITPGEVRTMTQKLGARP